MSSSNFLPAAQLAGGALPEKAHFDQVLNKLQQECKENTTAFKGVRAHNALLHVKLFLWLIEVQKVFGLWEQYIAPFATQRRPVRTVAAGINFTLLLRLGFPAYLAKDNNFIARSNELLNAINNEYKGNPDKYLQDAETKLHMYAMTYRNYKTKSKAIEKTQSAQQPPVATTNSTAVAKNRKNGKFRFSDRQRTTHMLQPAKNYFVGMAEGNAAAFTQPLLPAQTRTYPNLKARKPVPVALALIAQTPNGQFVIDAADATAQGIVSADDVEQMMIRAYRKSFAALPNSLRCVLEIIRSQMLTDNLSKKERKLIKGEVQNATVEDVLDAKTKKKIIQYYKKNHRLVYRHAQGDFLYSRCSTKLGMVTIAKPKTQVLEAPVSDLALLKRSLKKVTEHMLWESDFNMFEVSDVKHIPKHSTLYATNAVSVTSRANPLEMLSVDFWGVNPDCKHNQAQVDLNNSAFAGAMYFQISASLVKEMALDAVDQWTRSYGNHIARERNQQCELHIANRELTFKYFHKHDEYMNQFSFPLGDQGQSVTLSLGEFQTFELFTALSGIAAVVTEPVILQFNTAGILFSYSTHAADYLLAVPNRAKNSTANAAFTAYLQAETPADPEAAYETTDEDMCLVDM
jgi:hypothetical protein